MRNRLAFCVFAALACAGGGAVEAQKSKDTLRASVYQPIDVIDEVLSPNPTTFLLARPVAEPLLYYDSDARRVEPLLASAWRRIDDRTLELSLRPDVRFHDGAAVTADDVVYSFNYVTDPKENFPFKESRFGWIAGVEKVDARTVRIRGERIQANALARLTQGPPIYPAAVHGRYVNKVDFGRKPVATGAYKVASFDSSHGVVLEKNDAYSHGGTKPGARIGRIEVATIGDVQTQVARLMTGQQDFVYNVDLEQARSLVRDPTFNMFIAPTITFAYLSFDVADRSGIRVLRDRRVREAMLRAIDRSELRRALLPETLRDLPMQPAMCHPWVTACDFSLEPPTYDPAQSKRLLEEAGLAAGFDLTLTATSTTRQIAEALAGQLRAVGVRASIEVLTIGVWIKKRAEGAHQATVGLWDNAGGAPDVEWTTNFLYLEGSNDYYQDSQIQSWMRDGAQTLDPDKRRAIYRRLFDRVTEQRYSMPIIELPSVIVHHKDLAFEGGHKKPEGFEFHRIRWTK